MSSATVTIKARRFSCGPNCPSLPPPLPPTTLPDNIPPNPLPLPLSESSHSVLSSPDSCHAVIDTLATRVISLLSPPFISRTFSSLSLTPYSPFSPLSPPPDLLVYRPRASRVTDAAVDHGLLLFICFSI
ncbi:hypothetical protein SISNIDRAFT_482103 [Sistotremastrum niveocremeum HHB9708]|uniref:Uncharacterized protein n=1 Tax=Sistotremastrum niveocremeum HHB9708 TaxID=1314777 RepID=A0A164YRI1_9AGAM|nr:hypothetical protein SISNIDRAFT_482103 [Sistotremastrum niveocremeum HHB9708]